MSIMFITIINYSILHESALQWLFFLAVLDKLKLPTKTYTLIEIAIWVLELIKLTLFRNLGKVHFRRL